MSNFIKDLLGIKSNKKKKIKDSFSLPIKEIGDLMECKDGTYKIIVRVSPVNGELLSDDNLEGISSSIQGALNSFDGRVGIYIQSECIDINTNIENIEKRERELTSEVKVLLLEEQKKHIKSISGKSRNVPNFYTVFEIKDDNFSAARERLNDTYTSFRNELESQNMYVDLLYERQIKSLLYQRMNPESSQVEPCREDWGIDNIIPENAKIYRDGRHIEIENRIYRFFSIVKYPRTVERYRWLRKVFSMKGDLNIAITLTPKNKSTIMRSLSKAVSELGAKAIDKRKNEAMRQKYQAEADSSKELISQLGNDNISLYDVNITMGISAKDIPIVILTSYKLI